MMQKLRLSLAHGVAQKEDAITTTAVAIKTLADQGKDAAKQALETVEKNPGLVREAGDLAKATQRVAGSIQRSAEIFLPKVSTFEQARNKALELVGDLGLGSQPVIGRLKTSKGYGKIIGRRSADKKVLWRLDFDPRKGPHINIENYSQGKKGMAQKYCIPFDGDEKTVETLLKHLNR